jgi:hypothetical protein
MPATIDLSANNSRLTVSMTPQETDGERWVKLFKEFAFVVVYLLAGLSVLGTCLYLVVNSTNAETQKQAWGFIGLFLGALGGYHMRPRS